MDWYQYHESDIGDLVVHKDREVSDRLPSPDSWSRWGIREQEGLNACNNFFIMDMDMTEGDFNFSDKSFSNEIEPETSVRDKDLSSGSSVCGGLPEQCFPGEAISRDRPDYQLQDLAGFGQIDDFFLNSVLDDLPSAENTNKSFSANPEVQGGNILMANNSESLGVTNSTHSSGSSKYLKTHAFSPSGGMQKDVTAPCIVPCNSKQKNNTQLEALPGQSLAAVDQGCKYRNMEKEVSLEESILWDLETVISQFNEETRICFRDALYRLARNSKQKNASQNRDAGPPTQYPMLSLNQNETMRSGKRKATELETNTIDRAIANLMFNKMEFNVEDLPLATEKPVEEMVGTPGLPSYSLNQTTHFVYPNLQKLPGDAEVPWLEPCSQQHPRDLFTTCTKDPAARKSFVLDFGSLT